MSAEPSQPFFAGNFIKYHPVIKQELGSHNAALLFDRLEYWFSKKKNQFFKFIKPCDHPLYKRGDSWQEETGFSEKVFRRAFDKIGVRYKSKSEFNKSKDKFQGKLFAYYQDRQTKTTIFIRNNDKAKEFYARLKYLVQQTATYKKLDALFSKPSPESLTKAKIHFAKEKANVNTSDSVETTEHKPVVETQEEEGVSPEDGRLGRHIYKDNNIRQTSLSKTEKNSLFDLSSKASEQKQKNDYINNERKQVCLDLLHSWKMIIGDKTIPKLNPKIINKLYDRFKTVFNSSKTEWETHLHKIASSQFLMGDKKSTKTDQTYQLRFWVAISELFKDNINEGYYETGTRQNHHHEKAQAYLDNKQLQDEVKGLNKSDPIVKVKTYFLEKFPAIYKSVIKPATITVKDQSIMISCVTTWATNYLQNECASLLETLQNQMEVNVNVV